MKIRSGWLGCWSRWLWPGWWWYPCWMTVTSVKGECVIRKSSPSSAPTKHHCNGLGDHEPQWTTTDIYIPKRKVHMKFLNDEVYQYCWLQKQWLQFIVCDVDILFDPLTVTRAPGAVLMSAVSGAGLSQMATTRGYSDAQLYPVSVRHVCQSSFILFPAEEISDTYIYI